MIFWDTSAVVPLLLRERGTSVARAIVRDDPAILVWWATPTEASSAIARGVRSGRLTTSRATQARTRLGALRQRWDEIVPVDEVRDRAEDLVLRHPLRAADALQLGAALTWAGGLPNGHRFATLDDRLATAARQEGFEVLGAEG